ncbi:MAG: type III pantothenate kinase [Verrucomicrobiota bacterium]
MSVGPRFWVADLANTRTKLAPVSGGRLGQVRAQETAKLSRASLSRFLPRDKTLPLVLADVVPTKGKLLEAAWKGEVFRVRGRNAPGVDFDYPKPNEIGADRIANAAAARALYGCPVIVMDFGTVLDVEVIDAQGKFCGGALAPGWNLFSNAMGERTALVPHLDGQPPARPIARSTRDAVRSGCHHGYRGLARELLARIKAQLGARRVKVIITGGQGGLFAEALPGVTAVNPLLTLEGLRIMGTFLYG